LTFLRCSATQSPGMSFASEEESKLPFEVLSPAAGTDKVEAQVTDQDEIDGLSTPHVPPDGGLHAWQRWRQSIGLVRKAFLLTLTVSNSELWVTEVSELPN
jgi:hypothetical protein